MELTRRQVLAGSAALAASAALCQAIPGNRSLADRRQVEGALWRDRELELSALPPRIVGSVLAGCRLVGPGILVSTGRLRLVRSTLHASERWPWRPELETGLDGVERVRVWRAPLIEGFGPRARFHGGRGGPVVELEDTTVDACILEDVAVLLEGDVALIHANHLRYDDPPALQADAARTSSTVAAKPGRPGRPYPVPDPQPDPRRYY